MKKTRMILMLIVAMMLAILVAACGEGPEDPGDKKPTASPTTAIKRGDVQKQVAANRKEQRVEVPGPDNAELRNYNKATKTYNDENTILWCTTTWGNPSAPLVTIPVRGKLTSSTTSFLSPDAFYDRGNYSWQTGSNFSIDGLYHPNPPKYRYGFTPGDQLVDFSESMPTLCTTAMSKFQRQKTAISTEGDPGADQLTKRAEQQLRSGDEKGAQATLRQLDNSNGGG